MNDIAGGRGRSAWLAVWAFRLYPLLLLPLLLVLSRDYGNTWDEKIQQIGGEIAVDFWRGIPPPSTPADNRASHLYGALFDVICVAAQRVVPGDIWTTRHYVNAFFGWLGILFTGRLAARLFGRGTGLLAMVLLTLTPRYLGELANNSKDVPFAALTVAALFYLAAVQPRPPYLDRRSLLAFTAAAACALDVRAGGLLLLAYLAVALGVAVLRSREKEPRTLAVLALGGLAVCVAVLLLGTTFWPWAFVRPLVGPFLALQSFSHFFWNGSVAFAGRMIRAKALPWDYVPTWLVISTPPVLLVGPLLSWLRLRRRRDDLWPLLALWSATVFPMVYVTLQHSTLYNGIRHLLFVIPTLVILAAAGWTALLASRSPGAKAVAGVALAVGLAEPLVFCVRNHPNEVVYFNVLVGGPRGAFGRYDLDYFGNCVLQEVRWADRVARGSGLSLVVSGQPPHVVQFDAERFPSSLGSAGPAQGLHHLEIATVWGVGPQIWRAAAGSDVLHWTATSDGAVLCVTAKGPRFAEVAGRLRATLAR